MDGTLPGWPTICYSELLHLMEVGGGGQFILILPTIYNLKKKRVRGDTGATKTYTSSKKNNIQEPPVQDMKNCAV